MAPQSRKAQREAAKHHANQRKVRDERAIAEVRRILGEVDAGTFVGHIGSELIRQVAETEAYRRGDPAARALQQRAAEVVARFEQDEVYQQRCRAMAKAAVMPFTRMGN